MLGVCALLAAVALPRPVLAKASAPVVDSSAGRRAFADLGAYYADPERIPAYEAALDALHTRDPRARADAGRYLAALFAQSDADERLGRGAVRGAATLSRDVRDAAHRFRVALANEFGEDASGAGALPALDWLVRHERNADLQALGFQAIERVEGRAADALIVRVLETPRPGPSMVLRALREADRRSLRAAAGAVAALAAGPRGAVRDSALHVAPRLEPPRGARRSRLGAGTQR